MKTTRIALLLGSLLVALAGAEIAARAAGWQPNPRTRSMAALQAPWAVFDPELGWANGASHLTWGGGPVTFYADGTRRTGPDRPLRPVLWLLLGCSYTQGLNLADAQTFAWQLQDRFPDVTVKNFGTGGYGTYQSLLRLRRERGSHPALVIYGFGEFQAARDLATISWMHTFPRIAFVPPHVTLNGDQIVEHPLTWLPWFPIEGHSALVHLAAERYLDRYWWPPDKGYYAAQRGLLLAMRAEAEAQGARFLVANLWAIKPDRQDWRDWFAQERFDVADCLTDDLPFDHPDAKWARHHARCIGDAIARP